MLNIEGLGRQLDPDLDLWKTAKPFLDRWMSEQVGVRALVKGFKTHLPKVLEQAPELPFLVHQYLQRVDHMPKQQYADLQKELHVVQDKLKKQKFFSYITMLIAVSAAIISFYFYFK